MTRAEFIEKFKANPDHAGYRDVDDDILWSKLKDKPEIKAYDIEPDPVEYATDRYVELNTPKKEESSEVGGIINDNEKSDDTENFLEEKWRLLQTASVKMAGDAAQYVAAITEKPTMMDQMMMDRMDEGQREVYAEQVRNNIFAKSARDFHELAEYTLATNPNLQEPESFEPLGANNFYKPNVIANTIVQAIPSLVAAVGGGAYAKLPGVFGAAYGMGASSFYDTAIDAGEKPEKAQALAAIVGVVDAAISTVRFKPIIDALPGGKGLATKMLTKKFVEKGVIYKIGKKVGEQALYEAVEETAQEWNHMIAESFTVKGTPTHDEAVQRTLTSFYAGGVSGAPFGIVTGIQQNKEAKKRKEFNKTYSEAINSITPDRISYDVASNSVTINYENITDEEKQAMEDSGLADRLSIPNLIKEYPDLPIEMAVMMELNKNSEFLGDVNYEYDDSDNVAVYTSDQLIEMGYDDYLTRFENSILKEGDPEYEDRKNQYRLRDTGFNEETTDGGRRIVLKRGSNADTIIEEQVEQIYKRIAETNPELRQAIDDYLDNVRVVFESNGYTPPSNTDFFSKIMTFNVLGYASRDIEMATMATLPQPIIDTFLEIMGRQTDGTNLAFLFSRKKPSAAILPTESVVSDEDVQTQLDSEPDSDRAPPVDEKSHQLTSAQKEYFQDTKVVNEDGTPQVMYHGTTKSFDEFKKTKPSGVFFFTPDPNQAGQFTLPRTSKGKILIDEPALSGANIMPVYINATNLFDYESPKDVKKLISEVDKYPLYGKMRNGNGIDSIKDIITEGNWWAIEKYKTAIKRLGFDGFYIKENIYNDSERNLINDSESSVKGLAVFNSEQIKSVFNSNPKVGDKSFQLTATEEAPTLDRKLRTHEDLDTLIPEGDRIAGDHEKGQPIRHVSGRKFRQLPLDETAESPTVSQNDLTSIWNQALEESNLTIDDIPEGMNPNTPDFWNKSFELSDQARYWYEISAETVRDTFPDMSEEEIVRIMDIIGATSIQANPIMNVERTLSTLSEDQRGVPVETGLASAKPVRDALFGEGLAGLKTGNFADTFSFLLGFTDKIPLSTNDRQVASTFSIDGMEFGSDPRLYEAVSKFYMILRDYANSKLPDGADPYQTWQLQALGWVQERIGKGNESFDDLTIAFDQVLQKLVDNGVALSQNEDGKYIVTKEDLTNPKFTQILSPTTGRAQESQTATFEAATVLTEEGARASRIIAEVKNQLEQDQKPQIKARLEKILNEYKRIQYRALKAIGQRKKKPGTKVKKSIIDDILTEITGENVSLSRVEVGQGVYGTFDGDANPNIRVPMRTGLGAKSRSLTGDEISQVLAFIGKNLNQAAMAASLFQDTDGEGDTKSIFIKSKDALDESVGVLINEKLNEDGMDFSLNIKQTPNGNVININPHFSEDGMVAPDAEKVGEIIEQFFGTNIANQYKNSYESSYIEDSDYDSIIRRINEQSARRLHAPFRENRKRGERVLLSTIRGTSEITSETTSNNSLRRRIERTRNKFRIGVNNLKQAKKEIRQVAKGVQGQTDTQNKPSAKLLKQLTGKTFQLTGNSETDSDLFNQPPVKKSNTSPPGWWAEHVIPISTRLGNIDESIKNKLRQFEFDYQTNANEQRAAVKPFIEKAINLPEQVRADLDLALKNGDAKMISKIISENNMYEEFRVVREVLDKLHARANDAGFDVGYLENYFPRRVNDLEGLVDSLGKEMQGVFDRVISTKQKELSRKLELEERAQVINQIISTGNTGINNDPSATKERTVITVDSKLNQFYSDSESALMGYIDSMNEAIAVNNFFGKGEFKLDSIGVYVDQLVRSGELDMADQRDLANILRARFNRHPNRSWVAPVKNVVYAMTMGSFTSAVTQIGDLAWAIYKAGVHAPKALGMAIIGRSKIAREDIGQEKIGVEYENALADGFTAKSAKYLNLQFKLLGLNFLDGLGKETLINGAILKYQKMARRNNPKLLSDLEHVFGDRAADVVEQLKSGEITEDIKFLAFNTLSDFQPVTLSELPQGYAENLGGRKRMFYQLKTFTIKQLDVFRNEGISKITKGYKENDPSQIKEGFGNLTRLALLFTMCNAGADVLKDLMMRRPIHLDDYIISNVWRLFGLSRYNFFKVKENPVQGVAETLMNSPVSGILLDFTRDAVKLEKAATDGDEPEEKQKDFMDELSKVRSVQRIPFFGKLYYWWFGGGSTKILKQELDRYKKLSRKRLLTPSEQDEYFTLADEAVLRDDITIGQFDNHLDRAQGSELEMD